MIYYTNSENLKIKKKAVKKMNWAKSKIVVCFLIVTMLSVFSLGDLAAAKAFGRINTVVTVLTAFFSTPAYATNGSDFYPDCPDLWDAVVAKSRAAVAAGAIRIVADYAAYIAAAALAAAIIGCISPPHATCNAIPYLIVVAALTAAALIAAERAFTRAGRELADAIRAYNACIAGATGG